MHGDREMNDELAGLLALPEIHLDREIVGAGVTFRGLVGESGSVGARDTVFGALNDAVAENSTTGAFGLGRYGRWQA